MDLCKDFCLLFRSLLLLLALVQLQAREEAKNEVCQNVLYDWKDYDIEDIRTALLRVSGMQYVNLRMNIRDVLPDLEGTIKDIIPRYQTMRGYFVDRRFGWDCHGLPVECEVEKLLNISGKTEIEELGVDVFNEKCRSIVLRYTAEWEKTVTRMGRWVDFDRDYKTMDPSFMESIWWVFNSLWDKGLIYEGRKILPCCPRCSTPLSNFETNQGYKEVKDPAITVRFKIKDKA